MVFGGVVLVMSFAFAGHYMGQNAVAHNADPSDVLESISAPASNLLAKGSLMPQPMRMDGLSNRNRSYATEVVIATGKGDFIENEAEASAETVVIVPAAINLKAEEEGSRQKLALAPSPRQVEKAIKLKHSAARDKGSDKGTNKVADKDTKKEIAQRRALMAEENCLARAVYFEARSESELGQIAVAKVVLNRVKDPEYPNTICGVVYQGSGRRNSCQFSFACDGLPDDVKSASSWAQAKQVAKKTIAGDAKVAALTTATNYHADYVKPKWAKSMKRLVKIGRHIFYEDS
jgi:spore germination cell wall hydrolase CwlJ-like protein